MRVTTVALALVLGSCARPEPAEPPEDEPPPETRRSPTRRPEPRKPAPAPSRPALPDGFTAKGTPRVEEPFLTPGETWRFVVSRLTTLQGDVQVRGEDLLVTLEPAAVHVTDRAGNRRTWLLPEGLRLEGGPVHAVLKPDLFVVPYRPDGTQVPAQEEVVLVTARATAADGTVEVFRLVVKGGRAFRSISTPG